MSDLERFLWVAGYAAIGSLVAFVIRIAEIKTNRDFLGAVWGLFWPLAPVALVVLFVLECVVPFFDRIAHRVAGVEPYTPKQPASES